MWRVYLLSGLIACVVAALTAFVTVQIIKPTVPPTVILEGEEQVPFPGERVIYYKVPFASPPYLTFPTEGGYKVTDEKAESFKLKRFAAGQGISDTIKWKAEGQPAK